jgi:hypothetical protein
MPALVYSTMAYHKGTYLLREDEMLDFWPEDLGDWRRVSSCRADSVGPRSRAIRPKLAGSVALGLRRCEHWHVEQAIPSVDTEMPCSSPRAPSNRAFASVALTISL